MGKLQKQKVSKHTIEHSDAESQTHLRDKEEFHVLNSLRRLGKPVKGVEEEFKSVSAIIWDLAGFPKVELASPGQYFLHETTGLREVTGQEQTVALEADRARLAYHVSEAGTRCEAIPEKSRIKMQILPMLPPHSAFISSLPLEEQRQHIRLQATLIMKVAEERLGWRPISVAPHTDTRVIHFDYWTSRYSPPEPWRGRKIKEASRLLGDSQGFQNIGLTAASFFRYEADGHAQFTRPGHEEFARATLKVYQYRYPGTDPFDLHVWLKMDEHFRETYGKRQDYIESAERWYEAKACYHRLQECKASLKWARRDAEKDYATARLVEGLEAYLTDGPGRAQTWLRGIEEAARAESEERLKLTGERVLQLSSDLKRQLERAGLLEQEVASLQAEACEKDRQLAEVEGSEREAQTRAQAAEALVIQLRSENNSLRQTIARHAAAAEAAATARAEEEKKEALRKEEDDREKAKVQQQLVEAVRLFEEAQTRELKLRLELEQKEEKLKLARKIWHQQQADKKAFESRCVAAEEKARSVRNVSDELLGLRAAHDYLSENYKSAVQETNVLRLQLAEAHKELDSLKDRPSSAPTPDQQAELERLRIENQRLNGEVEKLQKTRSEQAFEISGLSDKLKDHWKYFMGYENTQAACKKLEQAENRTKELEKLLRDERLKHCEELNCTKALVRALGDQLRAARASKMPPAPQVAAVPQVQPGPKAIVREAAKQVREAGVTNTRLNSDQEKVPRVLEKFARLLSRAPSR